MKRDTTQWIISLGFTSLLILIIVVAYISLSEMSSTIKQMEDLVKVTNAKIASAHAMRDHIRLRADTLSRMYFTDDYFERDEILPMLEHHASEYRQARQELISYDMTEEEEILHRKITEVSEVGYQANISAAEKLMSGSPVEEIRNALRIAYNGRQQVLDYLSEMVDLQNRNAQLAFGQSVEVNQQTRKIVIVISMLSFFLGIIISLFAIVESTRKNREMHFQAHHDALTSLVNRKEFENRLQYAIDTTRHRSHQHALCFLDLDQFKIINDTCGHHAGDRLLIDLSQLIHKTIRHNDTLGRLGGDEFGLLLENCSLEKALEIAEGIVSLVRGYEFTWEGRSFHVGVSIGLVPITRESGNATHLMAEADVACYAAKDTGRNRVHVHELNDEQVRKIHQELSWVANIETSLKEQRFQLYLQPIMPVANNLSADAMYEVLLRIKDDEGRMISPGAYIPAAERFNLMGAVDTWVVQQVFSMLIELHRQEQDVPLIFINISANSLVDRSFWNSILSLLESHDLPDKSICFEITETAAIKNMDLAIEFMIRLKQAGCLFALDDFGSGMSSYNYLRKLPVDYLKIDGSIVKKIDQNTADRAMVAAINQIGDIMGIQTIAEHVENEAILNKLETIGVNYAQGYHLGRPVPVDQFTIQSPELLKVVS